MENSATILRSTDIFKSSIRLPAIDNFLSAWRVGDIPIICGWPIHYRFVILTVLALASSSLFLVTFWLGQNAMTAARLDQSVYRQMNEIVSDYRSDLLSMQTILNLYAESPDDGSAVGFRQETTKARRHLGELQKLPVAIDEKQALARLEEGLNRSVADFESLADHSQALGMTKSKGLRGKLNSSLKALQDELDVWPNQDALLVCLGQMRLAQRDFEQFKDKTSLNRHRRWNNEFDLKIDSGTLDPTTKAHFHEIQSSYVDGMRAYADVALLVAADLTSLRKNFTELQPVIDGLFGRARFGVSRATLVEERTQSRVMAATVTITLISGALFFFLTFLFQRSISKPIHLIGGAMSGLAKGNIGIAIPGTLRQDEIGEMARAAEIFKENLVAIKSLHQERETQSRGIVSRSDRLAFLTGNFDQTAHGIMKDVGDSMAVLNNTAESITLLAERTNDEVAEVYRASDVISARSQAAASAAGQLSTSIGSIRRNVGEANHRVASATEAVEKTDLMVIDLAEAAHKIGDVVTLISTVARQTNLLALNATIEAARAGEMGKGFAVIATEVKHLAHQTSIATSEIASQVKSIQSMTQSAVAAIRMIDEQIVQVRSISAAIDEGVAEQERATRDIAENTATAAQGAVEIFERISRAADQASNMGVAARNMLQEAGESSGRTAFLRDTVASFLQEVRAEG